MEYTDECVRKQPVWADNPAKVSEYRFNTLDGKIDRRSHEGEYALEADTGLPINMRGRTGMRGRGLLGRFGPNHAADPIVARWRRSAATNEVVVNALGLPVLEFVCIRRKDTGELAIPGGMVDAGESVSVTLKREFGEEALNSESKDKSEEEREKIAAHLETIFASGQDVYSGYVDDPRNTDNAWMETVAKNFHDATGESFGIFKLHAGDDAAAVAWVAYSDELCLYASHKELIRTVNEMRVKELMKQRPRRASHSSL